MGCGIAWSPLALFGVYFRGKYLIINHLTLVLASPGAGDLRQPLPNLSDRLVLAPQTTAYLSIAQFWILRERLGNPLIPKLPCRTCLDSLAKFLPGRSGVDTVNTTPKGEGVIILQNPFTSLWTTFLGIYQSIIQDCRSEFLNRVHKGYGLDSPILSGGTDKPTSVHSFLYCVLCVFPHCSFTGEAEGENQVKTRYQHGYFQPTPMPGSAQWEARAHLPCHIEVVQ